MEDRPVIDLDATQENRDWIKMSWDLPARTPEELQWLLQSWGMTEEQFAKLPVAKHAPWLQQRPR